MSIYKFLTIAWQKCAGVRDKIAYKGADFASWKTQEELGFEEKSGNKYQPSSGIIKKAFKELNITDNDAVIDIGCGKGAAMYMMSLFPFKKVDGYDLSQEMVNIANDNFKKLGTADRCHAFRADASQYKDYFSYNYFYAFNPVPEEVFKELVANIVNNINDCPRNCTFVYLNPVYDEWIQNNTPFKLASKTKGIVNWNDVYVYKMNMSPKE
ncbi:MAG: class I SAM-dependent methyltransferase [Butyrivibrio sp.]|nr:class I SAM-dependent methyltransferase [Butyrivibrio sp.]MBR1641473.1 class I SAM-dependent methyltransferase [Butyrivibrio sp.]